MFGFDCAQHPQLHQVQTAHGPRSGLRSEHLSNAVGHLFHVEGRWSTPGCNQGMAEQTGLSFMAPAENWESRFSLSDIDLICIDKNCVGGLSLK